MKKAKISVLFGVILFVLISPPFSMSIAQEDAPVQKLLLRLKPAIVLIKANISAKVRLGNTLCETDPLSGTGTGFIISTDGFLVTNGHVVEDYHESSIKKSEMELKARAVLKCLMPEVYKSFLTDQQLSQADRVQVINIIDQLQPAITEIQKDLVVNLSNGEQYSAEIKEYSPPISRRPGITFKPDEKIETGKDIAILKIEGRDLPTVGLGDSGNLQLGEPLYVIGYPYAVMTHQNLSRKSELDSTVTSGHVSGTKLDVKGTPVIQTDASLTWGNSGGPAFNAKGEVIGIATFISTAHSQQAQGFNFLVPINTAKEFVRVSGADLNSDSLFNRLWSEALELFEARDYAKTLKKIDEVNHIVPNQPDVQKLQLAAQEKLSSQKGRRMLPVLTALSGGIFLGGILLYAMRLRNRKTSLLPASPPLELAVQCGCLNCSEGPLMGRSFPIGKEGTKIGRDPDKNQIVIENDGVSREHAWVGRENGEVVVKDLDSLNGTYRNSTDTARIKGEALRDGDVIIIGKGRFAVFKYKLG